MGRRGGSGDHGWVVVVATAALVVAGCGGGDPSDGSPVGATRPADARPSPVGMPPSLPFEELTPLEWGDDLEHLVVITGNSPLADIATPSDEPAVGTPEIVDPEDLSPANGGVGTIRTGGNESADGMVAVRYLDGSEQLVLVPSGSLLAIPAVSWAERSLLDDPDVLLLVADPAGAIGPRGARYARSANELVQYTGVAPGQDEERRTSDDTAPATSPSVSSVADDAAITSGPRSPSAQTGQPTDDEIAAAIGALPGVVGVVVRGSGVLEVTADSTVAADLIIATPGVASVSPDVLFAPAAEPEEHLQWPILNTGASAQSSGSFAGLPGVDPGFPAAWTMTEGAGVVVAVIDSGVSSQHPDLVGQLWTNPGEVCGSALDNDGNGYRGDCRGWDFGDNDADPQPGANHHGTRVAGVVAAARNGVGIVGAAPAARIMALKVGRSDGVISMSSIAAAIVYAVDNGADVINLSLGTVERVPRQHVQPTESAIAHAHAHGVLVVAAAGNQGVELHNSAGGYWPAAFALHYDNVVAVGSHDSRDVRSSFSNHGSAVTLYAPGTLVRIADQHHGWVFGNGTSFASPHVAAAGALLISSGVATDPAAVRRRLVDTSVAAPYGLRLDAAAALGADRAATGPVVEIAGADTLAPDLEGRLTVRVRHHTSTPVSQVRISVATRHDGRVLVVDGLDAVVDDVGGELGTVATGASGSFPALQLRDLAGLASDGAELGLTMTLPYGDYAVVTEPLGANGTVVGPAWVSYLAVGTPSAAPPLAPSLPPGAPPSEPPPSNSTPPPGATAPDPTAPSPGTPAPDAPAVPPPGTLAPAPGTPAPGTPDTTMPPPDDPAPTAPAPGTPAPGTPAPGDPAPGTPAPGTPAPGDPVPGTPTPPPPGSPPPPTSATTTTVPTGGIVPPPITTPSPAPVVDGPWRLDGMSPRDATVSSGGRTVIAGVLPTNVPVYAWFGDLAIVVGTVTEQGLEIAIPTVSRAGRVDVHVRFRTERDHWLTLVDAFTFHPDGVPVPAPPGPSPSSTTTTPPPPGSAPPQPVPPITQAPAPPPPSATPPPATQPPSTHPPAAEPSPPPAEIRRGDLTLRAPAGSTAAGRLTMQSWPSAGCSSAVCTTVRF